MKRTAKILVALTQEEHDILQKAAEGKGLPLAAFVRSAALGVARAELGRPESSALRPPPETTE